MSITKDDWQHLVGGRYKHTALLLRTLVGAARSVRLSTP